MNILNEFDSEKKKIPNSLFVVTVQIFMFYQICKQPSS